MQEQNIMSIANLIRLIRGLCSSRIYLSTTVKWEVFTFMFRVISETFERKTNLTDMRGRLAPF